MREAISFSDKSSGLLAMDALHKNFFDAIEELLSAKDSEFHTRYDRFVAKTENIFATEEEWMEEIDFPGLKAHREQHARVLGVLHKIRNRIMNGDLALGREVADRLLPQWFVFHAFTMDTSLATVMQMLDENTYGDPSELSAAPKVAKRIPVHV